MKTPADGESSFAPRLLRLRLARSGTRASPRAHAQAPPIELVAGMLGRARRLALPFGLAWLALLAGVVPRFVLVWRTTSVSFVPSGWRRLRTA